MRVMTIVLMAEIGLLTLLWLRALFSRRRVRRGVVRCPLDGQDARLLWEQRGDEPPAPRDLLRCSLLEHDLLRGCDRRCMRHLTL
jgi:hypothetical protein